jgi:hypothetical protein
MHFLTKSLINRLTIIGTIEIIKRKKQKRTETRSWSPLDLIIIRSRKNPASTRLINWGIKQLVLHGKEKWESRERNTYAHKSLLLRSTLYFLPNNNTGRPKQLPAQVDLSLPSAGYYCRNLCA